MSKESFYAERDILHFRVVRVFDELLTLQRRVEETCATSAALVAQLQQIHFDDIWTRAAPITDAPELPPLLNPLTASTEPRAREKLAVKMMWAILNDFPVQKQVMLLKAITMRTMVLLHDEARAPRVLSA
jgi:hypothetical protein